MPTNDSNLTNTYIANTYQKLLQVDSQHSAVGSIPFDNTDVQNAIDNDSATILNGLGQKQTAIIIDHDVQYNNGGVFLKNTSFIPGGMWGIQVAPAGSESGLNFWGVGSIAQNYKLFLKNSGTLWVGYNDSSVPGTDESGYNLYVREGITSGKRVRTSSYNQNAVKDLWISYANTTGGVSLGQNEIYGVKKNEQVIIGGYQYINSGFQGYLTQGNGKAARIKNSDGNYANGGQWWEIFDGNGSGQNGWNNYNYANIIWNRVGPLVTVSFEVDDMYGSDQGDGGGIGRGIRLFYPCVLLDDDNDTVISPSVRGSNEYYAAGSGVAWSPPGTGGGGNHFVEVRSIGSIKWYLLSFDGDEHPRKCRGTFQYLLY